MGGPTQSALGSGSALIAVVVVLSGYLALRAGGVVSEGSCVGRVSSVSVHRGGCTLLPSPTNPPTDPGNLARNNSYRLVWLSGLSYRQYSWES